MKTGIRRISWKRVVAQVLLVGGLLSIDAALAAAASPAVFVVHQWLTLPGVMVSRAACGWDLRTYRHVTWTEVLINALILCAFAGAMAVCLETERRWRNAFRLVYATALVTVLLAWLVPHHMLAPWGSKKRGIALALPGDGSLVFGRNEELPDSASHSKEFRSFQRSPFPGVHHAFTVGPKLGDDPLDLAEFVSDSSKKRPMVKENTYTLRLWLFLLPFLPYPLIWIWSRETQRRNTVACVECGYNLTRYYEPTCPSCRTPNPHAKNVAGDEPKRDGS